MNNKIRIITFDIEDWFHIIENKNDNARMADWDKYESRIHKNVDFILNELQKKRYKASFFCLGWIAEKYPEIVEKIDKYGYEIGTHSYSHQIAYNMTPAQFREDLNKSKDIIESIISKPVRSFRTPGFSLTEKNMWVFEILAECGITIDSSIFPTKREYGGYSRFIINRPVNIKTKSGFIREFPINTISFLGKDFVFSGGGYFRIIPYKLIKKLFNISPYIMSYFHPRDFDSGQPVLNNIAIKKKFKSYVGLKKSQEKFRNVLRDYDFIDIAEAEKKIEWNINILLITEAYSEIKAAA